MVLIMGAVGMSMLGVLSLVVAQVTPDSADISAYLSGGGAVTAVGGLVFVAKKIVNGDLIARSTSIIEKELVTLLQEANDRQDLYKDLVTTCTEREQQYQQLLAETNRVLGQKTATRRQPAKRG